MDDHDRQSLNDILERIEREAYERGCRDTLRKFETFITNSGLINQPSSTTFLGSAVVEDGAHLHNDIKPANSAARPPEGSGEAAVLADIEQHPDSRGHEIAERLNGKVQERTVRTALHRLTAKRLIINIDKKWRRAEGVFE